MLGCLAGQSRESVEDEAGPPPEMGTPSMPSLNPSTHDLEGAEETVSYANGRVVTWLGWALWLVVVAANIYAIVTLGLGDA